MLETESSQQPGQHLLVRRIPVGVHQRDCRTADSTGEKRSSRLLHGIDIESADHPALGVEAFVDPHHLRVQRGRPADVQDEQVRSLLVPDPR